MVGIKKNSSILFTEEPFLRLLEASFDNYLKKILSQEITNEKLNSNRHNSKKLLFMFFTIILN